MDDFIRVLNDYYATELKFHLTLLLFFNIKIKLRLPVKN